MKLLHLLLLSLVLPPNVSAGAGDDDGKHMNDDEEMNGCNDGFFYKTCATLTTGCSANNKPCGYVGGATCDYSGQDYCSPCPVDTYLTDNWSDDADFDFKKECTACTDGTSTNDNTGSSSCAADGDADGDDDGDGDGEGDGDADGDGEGDGDADGDGEGDGDADGDGEGDGDADGDGEGDGDSSPTPAPAPTPATGGVCEKLLTVMPFPKPITCVDHPSGGTVVAKLDVSPEYPTGTQTVIETMLKAAGVPTPFKVHLELALDFKVCGGLKFEVLMSSETAGIDELPLFEIAGPASGTTTKEFATPISFPAAPTPGIVFVVFTMTMSGTTADSTIKMTMDLKATIPKAPSGTKQVVLYSQEVFEMALGFTEECKKNHKGYQCFKRDAPTNVNGAGSEFDVCVEDKLVKQAAVKSGLAASGSDGGGGAVGGAFAGALFLGLLLAAVGVGVAIRQQVFVVNKEKVDAIKQNGKDKVDAIKQNGKDKVDAIKQNMKKQKPGNEAGGDDAKADVKAAFDMTSIEEGGKKVVKNPAT
ncbi:hypothetical protein TeGR_g1538 [Tetraparma gracilis]|uniref:Uncharacterized protein n=1 Tax=Tetraparma gracilis TaxID=2962635 RepID=A0ABQ6NCW4_9STRA|nr:hypothetical protein TeGR_g1538 [Tetraparma gracilis]